MDTARALRAPLPTKRARKRLAQLRELIRLRHLEHLTMAECAERLELSERTCYYLAASPDYAALIEQMRAEWTEAARTEVASLGAMALTAMKELMMPGGRSEHVRFEAAAKVGDWLGLGVIGRETAVDDRDELTRLTKLIEEKSQQPNVQLFFGQVQPGGYLPAGNISPAGRALQQYAQGHDYDEETAVIEGEVVESNGGS